MTEPSLRVERGGAPTPEELVALVLAFSQLRATSTAGDVAGWQRAALHEGLGPPPISDVGALAAL